MKTYCSDLSGLCATVENDAFSVIDVVTGECMSPEVAFCLIANTPDWRNSRHATIEGALSDTQQRHKTIRAVLTIESCLIGMPTPLVSELLQDVEESIIRGALPDQIKSHLMIAPIQAISALKSLITNAVSQGLGAVAEVLSHVLENQPGLTRLVSIWRALDDRHFSAFENGKRELWQRAVADLTVIRTLGSQSHDDVRAIWMALALSASSIPQRPAIARIAHEISSRLYPSAKGTAVSTSGRNHDSPSDDARDSDEEKLGGPLRSPHALYSSAKSQVEAIVENVAAGRDALAGKILTDLIHSQTRSPEDHRFAVKSLCNIARQCKSLYRSDFEFRCLSAALEILPDDSFALLQLGDHFKRVGRPDDALRMFELARDRGGADAATRSIAAYYADLGDSERAIEEYQKVNNWEADQVTRTALADILRKRGDFDQAIAAYNALCVDGLASDRSEAGIAEIRKQRNDFDSAKSIYSMLLSEEDLDADSQFAYRISLGNVYMRAGEYDAALEMFDGLIRDYPFAVQPKILRSAVYGLMGHAGAAIKDLPSLAGERAFDEWLYPYVHGLLLLKLRRFGDARNQLLSSLASAAFERDSPEFLRLAAAVAFLGIDNGAVAEATKYLSNIDQNVDPFLRYLSDALRLHAAMANSDSEAVEQVRGRLRGVKDEHILRIVTALDQGDFETASRLEIDALLRIAA